MDTYVTEFTAYVTQKIEEAIEKHATHTEIKFSECPAMVTLFLSGKRSIDEIYDVIEADFFNRRQVDLFFGGYNLGSSVSLEYLKDEQPRNKVHQEVFDQTCEAVAKWCGKEIGTHQESFKVPRWDIEGIHPSMNCYWGDFPYVYLAVSKRLELVGWMLKKSAGGMECHPMVKG